MIKKLLNSLFVVALGSVTVAQGQSLNVLPSPDREVFHDYLMEELNTQHDQRVADIEAALATKELLEAKQAQLRSDYRMLIGDLPEETDLNPVIVKTITESEYKIDLLTYESRPDHHVTAHFYYPTTGSGPYPAILFTVGHYNPESKSKDLMQNICIMLAKNGIAALIVDPICQGERYQIFKPDSDELQYPSASGTTQHTMLDVGSMLTGTSVVAYELWDNIRGLDYLVSRPEVDTARIGNAGDSGGGAQATYLMAYDSRIKVSVVCSYIMNEPTLFETIGPQTASQNLSYEGYYGIDHPSYITMFAPKPFMIIADSKDFFDIAGSQETYEEVKKVYEKLGEPDKIGYSTHDSGHGYDIAAKREATVTWFRKWFYDDDTPVSESASQNVLATEELQVTTDGNVVFEYDDEVVVDEYNSELAVGFESDRSDFWTTQSADSCLNKVRDLIMLEETPDDVTAEVVETIERENYKIEKIKLTSGNMTPILGLLFIPNDLSGQASAVMYLDGRHMNSTTSGKSIDANEGGIIEKLYMDSGKIVFAVDVRGFGETNDTGSEGKHNNDEHRNAVISGYTGKTLIGQRVQDIDIAKEYLVGRSEVDAASLSIVGIGRAGTSVLHAAALDPDFEEIELRQWTDESWVDIVGSPTMHDNLTHVVPSALKFYDLPDLVSAAAPREVNYVKLSEASLRDLTAGDSTVVGFDPSQTTYTVAVDPEITRVPRVRATATDVSAEVTITQAESVPGTTTVEVLAEDGTTSMTYEVNFTFLLASENNDRNVRFNLYPNPSHDSATLSYQLEAASDVVLQLFDMSGKLLQTLVNEKQMKGVQEIPFSSSQLNQGVYFAKLKVNDEKPYSLRLVIE